MDVIVAGGDVGIPIPVTIIPVERPTVERIPVILLKPDVVVPLLSVKVRGTAADAVAFAVKVIWLALSTVNMVAPAGIPGPLTVVPTFKLAVEGSVTTGERFVVVPLVSVKVSGYRPVGAVEFAERVMSVPLTMDAIVVPAGIPVPLTAVPTIKPTVVGSPVTVLSKGNVVVPVRVVDVLLVAVTV
jgi:hypothetical protein